MAGQEKIRVLQIAGGFRANVNGKPISGGVAAFLHNYCPKANLEKFAFDFMSLRNQCFEQYRKDLENIGGTLYCLNLQSNGIKRAVAMVVKLRKFLKQHHYDAVHINMGSFFPVLCCSIAAKLAGVKVVIAHSHSNGIYSKKKDCLRIFLRRY